MVPLHWATFDLALHPWYEPIERALAIAEEKDTQMITPLIGEKVALYQVPRGNHWWRDVDGIKSESNISNTAIGTEKTPCVRNRVSLYG